LNEEWPKSVGRKWLMLCLKLFNDFREVPWESEYISMLLFRELAISTYAGILGFKVESISLLILTC
jgi:hypothetical protein